MRVHDIGFSFALTSVQPLPHVSPDLRFTEEKKRKKKGNLKRCTSYVHPNINETTELCFFGGVRTKEETG